MRYYYYITSRNKLIRVCAKRKPYKRERSYVVYELTDKGFLMPCFPEIYGGSLEKMRYIGSLKQTEAQDE